MRGHNRGRIETGAGVAGVGSGHRLRGEGVAEGLVSQERRYAADYRLDVCFVLCMRTRMGVSDATLEPHRYSSGIKDSDNKPMVANITQKR